MPLSRPARRARLSMTSLIDVIFLLLLFFMLSSTFSKFAEVELTGAGAGAAAAPNDTPTERFFLRLAEDGATLNGQAVMMDALGDTLRQRTPGAALVLVTMTDAVTAQMLTDALAALNGLPDLTVSVLGSG